MKPEERLSISKGIIERIDFELLRLNPDMTLEEVVDVSKVLNSLSDRYYVLTGERYKRLYKKE